MREIMQAADEPTLAVPDVDDLSPDPLGYLMDEAQAIRDDIEEIEIGPTEALLDYLDEAQAIAEDLGLPIPEDEGGDQGIVNVPTTYLAGPMSGKPDFNFPAFHEAALKLRQAGLNVLNPADNFDGDTSHKREVYMSLDVFHVLNSNMVVLLPGWQHSRGATLEAYLAYELGLPLFFYKPEGIEPCTVDPRVALRSYLTKATGKAAKRKIAGAPNVKMSARPVATRNGKELVPA